MFRYIINRILIAIPVIMLVMVITFTLGYYAPGDPVVLIYNEQIAFMTPEQLVQIRHTLGLDRTYPEQALDYITKVARGDLGTSIQTHLPVLAMIETGLPVTIQIAAAALILLVIIGI